MRFEELPRQFQRRIEETEVTIFAIQSGTPEKVKFNIFKRINTGGLPLSPQEIRNALNGSRVRKFLLKLSQSPDFLAATRHSIRDKRMADRECVTRFLAFVRNSPEDYNAKDFDTFLNDTMHDLNDPNIVSDQEIDRLEKVFAVSMQTSRKIFGKFAFRKFYGTQHRLSPINKALFEAWSVNLAILTDDQREQLANSKKLVLEMFAATMDDPDFVVSISQSTGSPSRVRTRFSCIADVINEALSDD